MITTRFDFIESEWPHLFEIILDIERNLSENPNISMIKLRQLVEFTTKHIVEYENIQLITEKTGLKTIIETLLNANVIPIKSVNLLNMIRKTGNKAVHDNYSDSLQTVELYNKTFDLLAWFAARYGALHHQKYLEGLDVYDKVVFLEYLLEFKLPNQYGAIRDTKNVINSRSLDAQYASENKNVEQNKKQTDSILSTTPSVESIKKAAEKGDSDALFKLGNIYMKHYEEIEDDGLLEDALSYYKASAKKKNIPAILKLIEIEWESEDDTEIDVEIDFELDVKWIRDVAIQGNTDAQYLLGQMYFYGIEVEENEETALKWIKLSAKNGNSKANADARKIEEFRIREENRKEEAARRLEESRREKAAKNAADELKFTKERAIERKKNAAFKSGKMYEFGLGVDIDMKAAMEWYQLADRLGYSINASHKNLGYYYYSIAQAHHYGVMVKENIHLAKANYQIALRNGYEPAREILKTM